MNEINPAAKTARRTAINRPSSQGKSGKSQKKPESAEQDRVTLSVSNKASASKSTGSPGEIRHDLVNKFKAVVQNGGYRVKAEELADKMVQKIRDEKGTIPF